MEWRSLSYNTLNQYQTQIKVSDVSNTIETKRFRKQTVDSSIQMIAYKITTKLSRKGIETENKPFNLYNINKTLRPKLKEIEYKYRNRQKQ